MGVKLLNSLIRNYCKESNELIPLFKLKNKVLTVDISIYIYRFKSDGKLMENMYMLCSILRFYNIKPLFIFDGVPPGLKEEELNDRKKQKIDAKKQFEKISKTIVLNMKTIKKMNKLRRIFTSVTKKDIEDVKKLLNYFGLSYITAESEADELCAKFVITGRAYACLSEDTDLFVYGCPRVLRYLSLRNHTTVIYHMDQILKNLNLNMENFRKMCVISGTDYNKNNYNIYYNYDIYKKGGTIQMTKEEEKIYEIFKLNNQEIFKDLLIENSPINKSEICNFMSKYNFVLI